MGGGWTSHCFHIEMFTSSDRLGRTSERYIEVEQKGGQPPWPTPPKHYYSFIFVLLRDLLLFTFLFFSGNLLSE